ncbi:MAG: hypothetical protein K0Q47_94 [Sedimentibacter sp.]|jgi:hypothetical protein|nr:hypothetical protein [Sedimentibacter sp.]
MVFIPFILFLLILIFCLIKLSLKIEYFIGGIILGLILLFAVIAADEVAQTTDTEVWSGSVIDWKHTEEYDEKVYEKDKDGNVTGYHYDHHYAENKIKTSDNGWITVKKSPDGKKFTDKWPNKTSELKEIWPEGTPTASSHTYVNKIQASYSIYKHEEIDLDQYKDLPKYPDKTYDYLYIDRIVGDFPNELESRKLLDQWNTELNKFIPDPEKPGKNRSWKQVNIIFVNVGPGKSVDYGFALQDYWEGGNKNDFVVSLSMEKDGTINWVYPFSWSEVEILKIEVRDYITNLKVINDLSPIIDKVSQMVADKFERKQFADYNYLNIDVSNGAIVSIWVLFIILSLGAITISVREF